uniref:Uncharacterized protein n=1 Tax=Oryza brachyantha TaxID=4533 RepID=J3MRJ2_ORYBR
MPCYSARDCYRRTQFNFWALVVFTSYRAIRVMQYMCIAASFTHLQGCKSATYHWIIASNNVSQLKTAWSLQKQ